MFNFKIVLLIHALSILYVRPILLTVCNQLIEITTTSVVCDVYIQFWKSNLQVTIRTINDCLSVFCMIFFEFAICAIIYIKNIFIQLVIIIRLHTLHLMRSAMLSLPLRCSILIYKLYLVFIKSYIFMLFCIVCTIVLACFFDQYYLYLIYLFTHIMLFVHTLWSFV